jgi:hypothetical protein
VLMRRFFIDGDGFTWMGLVVRKLFMTLIKAVFKVYTTLQPMKVSTAHLT